VTQPPTGFVAKRKNLQVAQIFSAHARHRIEKVRKKASLQIIVSKFL